MKLRIFGIAVAAVAMLTACSTPEERAAEAQERSFKADAKLKEKRLKMIDEYQKCVTSKAPEQAETCDYLLKAIEAVR